MALKNSLLSRSAAAAMVVAAGVAWMAGSTHAAEVGLAGIADLSLGRDRFALEVRHQRFTSDNDESAEEAQGFAARLKHKQGKNLARKKRRFRQQQAWLEKQRRVTRQKKAAAKAHQYAAARRAAAKRHTKKPRRHHSLK